MSSRTHTVTNNDYQEAQDKHNLTNVQIQNLIQDGETQGIKRAQILAELKRSSSMDAYAQKRGAKSWEILKEMETARERSATNKRVANSTDANTRISAAEKLATAGAFTGGDEGKAYTKAGLGVLAKQAGVELPTAAPNPVQSAYADLKGQPATGASPAAAPPNPANAVQTVANATSAMVKPGQTTGLVENESLLTPDYSGDERPQPVDTRGLNGSIAGPQSTDPLALTGSDPWTPGGAFDNPTHAAAMNQQAMQKRMYPTGPVTPGSRIIPNDTPWLPPMPTQPNRNPAVQPQMAQADLTRGELGGYPTPPADLTKTALYGNASPTAPPQEPAQPPQPQVAAAQPQAQPQPQAAPADLTRGLLYNAPATPQMGGPTANFNVNTGTVGGTALDQLIHSINLPKTAAQQAEIRRKAVMLAMHY